MNDPRRLLDQGADDFTRALLSSAERDVGSPRAAARCLAAAGTTALVAKTAGASGALFLLPALKAGVVGAVLGLLVSGASVVVSGEAPTAKVPSASHTLKAPLAPAQHDALPTLPTTPSEHVELPALPDNEAARSVQVPMAQRSARTAPTNAGSAQGSLERGAQTPDRLLEREVVWLDQARQALASGNARGASQSLDGYDREFPRGALQPEALFLRVQVLLGEGRRDEANALARRLVVAHPAAAHAQKLKEILEHERSP